jgi:hypothetical protein
VGEEMWMWREMGGEMWRCVERWGERRREKDEEKEKKIFLSVTF